mmetsp:Transcript_14753/g.41547  ORF Transcript_14753/g.41547 Transcript_14753/m.41547 type:complete len:163 (+) Transcript_14753:90-578(+)
MATLQRAEQERARQLKGRLEFAERLASQLSASTSVASQTVAAYTELLDGCLLDVAIEVHRAARSAGQGDQPFTAEGAWNGEDEVTEELMQSYWSTSGLPPKKVTQDVFGQQHSNVASDPVECVHCGRKIVAGRFAPHLEKCLGKGRGGVRAASRRQLSRGEP